MSPESPKTPIVHRFTEVEKPIASVPHSRLSYRASRLWPLLPPQVFQHQRTYRVSDLSASVSHHQNLPSHRGVDLPVSSSFCAVAEFLVHGAGATQNHSVLLAMAITGQGQGPKSFVFYAGRRVWILEVTSSTIFCLCQQNVTDIITTSPPQNATTGGTANPKNTSRCGQSRQCGTYLFIHEFDYLFEERKVYRPIFVLP